MNVQELIQSLVPMGSDPVEIEKMVRIADSDGDGEACTQCQHRITDAA